MDVLQFLEFFTLFLILWRLSARFLIFDDLLADIINIVLMILFQLLVDLLFDMILNIATRQQIGDPLRE